MKIAGTIPDMRSLSASWRSEGLTTCLVPTMGALHKGHISLIALAKTLADRVVVSIFVNPTQFGPNEDFEKYPRAQERDTQLCEREGADAVFAPSASAMYPTGYSTYVEETVLSRGLCGASRPGHFRGVTTIVSKLFNIVEPNFAVFGQKDAQQVRIIEQMVRDLDLCVNVVIAPTLREEDGLAMSSRNSYLLPPDRVKATCLYRGLCAARDLFEQGESSSEELKQAVCEKLEVPGVLTEYVEVVDYLTLQNVLKLRDRVLVALAVRIGGTRLIDNMVLGKASNGNASRGLPS